MDQGLFGPSPAEIQQMQTQAMMQRAQQFAEMNPQQRATAGMYKAGGMLAGPVGGMLGMTNPAVEQAKRTEQIMGSGGDLTTSEGMLKKADEFRQAGDIRTATALLMKGKEMQRQEQAAALAARKQDFQENQQYELKLMQLAQMGEAARQRSEDTRMSIEQRREAAREANAIRLEIAKLAAAAKQGGAGGMTPAQAFKQKQAEAKSNAMLKGMETDFKTLKDEAEVLKSHPGLGGATGIRGALPSVPGGDAAKAQALLEGFKARVKNTGLQIARQGGGIGQITEKEWGIIEAMVANIDPIKLGREGTIDEINKVIAKAEATLNNARMQHGEAFMDEEPSAPATPPQPAAGGWAIRKK